MFCSSSNLVPKLYREDAVALADRMAEEGISLIYGGGSVGLMGILADRILSRGGKVIGVIPGFLRTEELAHEGLTEMIITESMHERKTEMSRRADAFAILPGGFGTMDEFFEILTWKQLGLHSRPIVVANTGGWFDPILAYFRLAESQRMVSRGNLGLIDVVDSGEKVVDVLLRRGATGPSVPRLSRT
ncbi:MAG TPA: TIGR00730 family Rossman fold protein [Candidatus Deferrimicrobiaceae bacterium]|nr:TIGR00730 family Rossman fold protein [Candidatus Deferrimicrobiaceae bacterium]